LRNPTKSKNTSAIIRVGFYVEFQNAKLAGCFVGEKICWVTQKTLTQPTLLKPIIQVRLIIKTDLPAQILHYIVVQSFCETYNSRQFTNHLQEQNYELVLPHLK
jgi:hypothetical protein